MSNLGGYSLIGTNGAQSRVIIEAHRRQKP